MKKIITILTALFAVFIVFGIMGEASASELDQELMEDFSSTLFTENSIEEHEHDAFVHDSITGDEQITVFALCYHVGTLKETKYVGFHSKCGGPLYKVYCKPCGKLVKTLCLCP